MCGIYGIFDLHDGSCLDEAWLTKMGNVIHHRGPDDFGHLLDRQVALGMRRLSIIDVQGGHQPMANEDGS